MTYRFAAGLQFGHGRFDGPVGTAPAQHQHAAGFGAAVEGLLRNVFGDLVHLGLAGLYHVLVVVGIVAHVSGTILLFESADAVLQSGRAGYRPGAYEFFITLVGPVFFFAFGKSFFERNLDIGQVARLRETPGLGAVGNITVAQEQHRRHVLQGDAAGLEHGLKTIGRRTGRYHRHGAFAVAAIVGLHQVALLRFGRETRRGTAPLDIDDHQGDLQHDGQTHGFALEGDTRTAGRGHAQGAPVGSADGGSDRGDLIFGLEGLYAEILMAGQFVQDIRSGGDGVRSQEQGQAAVFGSRDQAIGYGLVAHDGTVHAFFHLRLFHLVGGGEGFGGIAVIVTGLQHLDIAFEDIRLLGKFFAEKGNGAVHVAVVHPVQESQHEHVLGPVLFLGAHGKILEGLTGHLGNVHPDHLVIAEAVILEGILAFGIVGQAEVLGIEPVRIGNDLPTLFKGRQVHFQGGCVHGHQHITGVAGGKYPVGRKAELESAHPGNRTLGGPDLRGEIGESGQVNAHQGGIIGKLAPGQLHSVAAVAGELDHHVL